MGSHIINMVILGADDNAVAGMVNDPQSKVVRTFTIDHDGARQQGHHWVCKAVRLCSLHCLPCCTLAQGFPTCTAPIRACGWGLQLSN